MVRSFILRPVGVQLVKPVVDSVPACTVVAVSLDTILAIRSRESTRRWKRIILNLILVDFVKIVSVFTSLAECCSPSYKSQLEWNALHL